LIWLGEYPWWDCNNIYEREGREREREREIEMGEE
jgi:hypothetical protein